MFSSTMVVSNAINFSSISMIITGLITFITCLIIVAPYGRYSKRKGWGVLLPAKLAWILMESPNIWVPIFIFRYGGIECHVRDHVNAILLGCFLLHYVNRAIIFPLRMRTGNPMPISVMALAFAYCIWNSSTQAAYLLCYAKYPDEWIFDIRFISGILLFFIGMVINIHSDNILLALAAPDNIPSVSTKSTILSGVNLSNSTSKNENPTKVYKIPYGGMFEYISCANYGGEILEWAGFAIASWSLPATAFAIFTFCNIGPRGYQHHLWYKTKFENYPTRRKAVIPFIW